MKPKCRACNQPYTPAKPYHVLCFACWLVSLRDALDARRACYGDMEAKRNRSKQEKTTRGK